MSLKDLILNSVDRKPVPATVPEWNCTVYIRQLSGKERQELGKKLSALQDDAAIELTAFVACVVDENDVLLFDESSKDALALKNGAAISRVARRALHVNGFGKTAVDDHEKN